MPATEDASTELFEGIDEVYFLEIGFKAVNHELEVFFFKFLNCLNI